MPDFTTFDALESTFPRLSGVAFKAAHDRTLAAGVSVAVLENGGVFEVAPSGERTFIHAVRAPMAVQIGARYVRR